MNYIVMDLEFNQPYDFAEGPKSILVEECPFEIIQIGVVKLDQQFNQIKTGNFLAKPQVYTRIHPHVERITQLTIERLEDQPYFPEAFQNLINFIGNEPYIFCIWGSSDLKLLHKNIYYHQLDGGSLSTEVINVQELAARYLKQPRGLCIGLKKAVEALSLPLWESLQFHDALHDAMYTAEILKKIAYPYG